MQNVSYPHYVSLLYRWSAEGQRFVVDPIVCNALPH